jgi:O-antigen/teichoic acid export membrane protein
MLSADWLLTGLERYGILFSRDALLKSASLVLLFLLVGGPGDYTRFMAIGLGIAAASGAWGLIQARAFVRPEWRGLAPAAHLPSLSVMLACSLTSGVYAYLDNVVVGFLTDDHSVGLYAAATRTNRMVVIFLTSLGTAIIPRLSYYSQQNMAEESRKVAAKTIRFMFLIAWPVSSLFLALAPQILELISGRDFLPAAGAMRISVPVIAASVFTNYLAFHVLFPIGGEKSVLLGTSLAAAINLLANLLLIPAWGIEGAALASVLGQLACGAVLWAGVRRRGLLPNPWEGSANYLAAAAVLALAAWLWVGFAAPRPKEILLFFAGSACAYCGFLYLIRDSLAVQILESAMGRFLKRPDV